GPIPTSALPVRLPRPEKRGSVVPDGVRCGLPRLAEDRPRAERAGNQALKNRAARDGHRAGSVGAMLRIAAIRQSLFAGVPPALRTTTKVVRIRRGAVAFGSVIS